MGFITVVIQLALLFVFSIYCQNTIANDLFDKVEKECVAWRIVPCQKGMTPRGVISEEGDDPECYSYEYIPCQKIERHYVIHNVKDEKEENQDSEKNSNMLNECEFKNKRCQEDLAVVLNKLKDCTTQ
jgi:hypothetical protein